MERLGLGDVDDSWDDEHAIRERHEPGCKHLQQSVQIADREHYQKNVTISSRPDWLGQNDPNSWLGGRRKTTGKRNPGSNGDIFEDFLHTIHRLCGI